MSPEQQNQPPPRGIDHAGVMVGEAARLEEIAAQLMAVQRCWDDPDRELRLSAALEASRGTWHAIQAALAEGVLTLPPELQHNLLILSVYADSKISACESIPCPDTLSSLIALTRTLAGSLKERQVAP